MITSFIINELKANWRYGALRVFMPDGRVVLCGQSGESEAVLRINSNKALRRLLFAGDIGLYEAYKNHEIETDDLFALLSLLANNLEGLKGLQDGGLLKRIYHFLLHRLKPNSRSGSRRNIYAHYDLGNAFFEKWLDPSMTYSSALYENTDDLREAQAAKYREIARMVDLQPGQSVLEIGCGWGGFATYAAEIIGANVTCVTISQAQYDYVRQLIKTRGLEGKISVKLCDYRDLEGNYDAIVSIEMFEAVGEAYWNIFFEKLKRLIKPKGKIGLQIITIRDDLFDTYRNSTDFIQNYVFPGGMLPSIEKLQSKTRQFGFVPEIKRAFGHDYARTLTEWAAHFDAAWDKGQITGFDNGFKRLWHFYLAYCVAGFNSRRTDVIHLLLKS